jgi:hypothetical protein
MGSLVLYLVLVTCVPESIEPELTGIALSTGLLATLIA